ncbi:hypothetical protein [Exiguobacterium sp. BMC-KP]|nr:hypothetical protein [Exiguobacterium sp. BMC-KP]
MIYRQDWINSRFRLFDPSKFQASVKIGRRLRAEVAMNQLQRTCYRT